MLMYCTSLRLYYVERSKCTINTDKESSLADGSV